MARNLALWGVIALVLMLSSITNWLRKKPRLRCNTKYKPCGRDDAVITAQYGGTEFVELIVVSGNG